ncbi:MAG: VOC family protein, partial [Planctomycetota bacterium]|nr:VOC family protein [Planctomycetota bacterium]
MTETKAEPGTPGIIGWTDLTVEDAETIRDFYAAVVGWKPEACDMGGYSDFIMTAPTSGTAVTGICHKRGSNASMPSQWMVYINVEDIATSIERCRELGGEVLVDVRNTPGQGSLCVIRDPAGAVAAL